MGTRKSVRNRIRSETANSVLAMRSFLRSKKEYCHDYELPINDPKQNGQLLCTVLEIVDLLCLFPAMFFRKRLRTSMIQNYMFFLSNFCEVLHFKLSSSTKLQYQLKNSEACILNLICCNLSAVVPAPLLGGAAVKEGKPFPA